MDSSEFMANSPYCSNGTFLIQHMGQLKFVHPLCL